MSKYIKLEIETLSENENYCGKHCNYFSKEDSTTKAECSLFRDELLFEKFEGEYLAMRHEECIDNECISDCKYDCTRKDK